MNVQIMKEIITVDLIKNYSKKWRNKIKLKKKE